MDGGRKALPPSPDGGGGGGGGKGARFVTCTVLLCHALNRALRVRASEREGATDRPTDQLSSSASHVTFGDAAAAPPPPPPSRDASDPE